MDRNTIIGFSLIFILLIGMQYYQKRVNDQYLAEKAVADSIALEQQRADSIANQIIADSIAKTRPAIDSVKQQYTIDSVQNLQKLAAYGPFANAASGEAADFTLENDLIKVTFSNKGGQIKSVLLKEYYKMTSVEEGENYNPLYLLEDEKNKFEYLLPVPNTANGNVRTSDLYFEATPASDAITFRAKVNEFQYFEQKYTIGDGYTLDYEIRFIGLENVLTRDANTITLNWVDYLDKIERNVDYESRMSSIYFKPAKDDATYCNCNRDDVQDYGDEALSWISNSNQFFNAALLTKNEPFQSGILETKMLDLEEDDDLKLLSSKLQIPYQASAGDNVFPMQFYIGPKEYDRLVAIGNEFEYTIPFGISIFGTVNRYIIRPLFGFLLGLFSSKGIVILVLTVIVKLLLFPLTYRMIRSQSKMSALKPQIDKLRNKFKDDQQQQQMETMKLYREYGASPLGGCLPMVMQMPIWFALYRFFPASIEFRQASFLWANDLSSFDVFAMLPFGLDIPFYGKHISLFTILWAVSTIAYTVYNTRNVDMSSINNPAMKYMQYFMPVMFLFFFNNFASGLTCYLLFSSVFNIAQTVVTKNYLINEDKIQKELQAKKAKNKGKKGFQARLEEAMKQQQAAQARRQQRKSKSSGKKKK